MQSPIAGPVSLPIYQQRSSREYRAKEEIALSLAEVQVQRPAACKQAQKESYGNIQMKHEGEL